MSRLYMVVTPYNPEKTDEYGKKYLVRIPDRKYVEPGEVVIALKANGRESLYTALTPEFYAEDTILSKWGASEESIRTVVAILRREDLDIADESVMRDIPVIDG